MKQFPKLISFAIGFALPVITYAGQWQGPLNGIVNDVIKSGYETYATSAQTLQTATAEFCAKPNPANKELAQQAFQHNTLDWQQVQWLNFGPVTYFMRYYAFEYWPDKKGVTQRQLRSLAQQPDKMDAPKFWTSASIAVRGLTAIESLMYHPDFTPLTSPEHCHLLTKVTQHQYDSAKAVAKQWQESQAQDWIFAEEGTQVDNEHAALEQMLQQWLEHMSAVKDAKLENPIGYKGRQNLKLAEFYRSKLSLPSIQANLLSYRKIYHAGKPSLYDIAEQQYPQLADKLENALSNNQKLALQLPEDYFWGEYNQAQRTKMAQPLINSLSNSQTYLTQLVTQLGFQIGFNSRDGD
ncbi:imelysin family protein [Marinomonas sp. THO17]|uniref:imelysin family protein n=1 Tax=Marinomonas sp. THO17 TaxID=3149048 RepID=UPI00336BD4A4